MAFGLSFGKKKGSETRTTDTNIKETATTAQTQATTGSTQTNTSQTGSQSGSSTGLQSSDKVDRSNQTQSGTTTTTGQTTTLDGDIQSQLKGALGSMLGSSGKNSAAVSNAAAGLLDFNSESFINDTVRAAEVRGQNQLQETNSGIANAIGGTAGDNTMAALLAQRGSNDLAANLAGIRAQATETAAGIERGNVSAASAVDQSQAGTVAAIGELLKGATTTTTQQSLEEQIAALVGSSAGNTRTNETNQQQNQQNSSSNQLVQELINALSNTNSTKVGTENSKGTTKNSGGGFSFGM